MTQGELREKAEYHAFKAARTLEISDGEHSCRLAEAHAATSQAFVFLLMAGRDGIKKDGSRTVI